MMNVPKYISELKPYIPGKTLEELSKELTVPFIAKLASNENPLGPSPKAIHALQNHLSKLHLYPDPTSPALIEALSKKFRRAPSDFICAHGIDGLLEYTLLAFSKAGDEVLTSEKTFIGFTVNANKLGRHIQTVPQKNFTYDLKKILGAITKKTKIIYIANPNNPTGTSVSKADFEGFMEKVPQNILVILDEAYIEYVQSKAHIDGSEYTYPNLVVMRTFSKFYGLAGLRVGYALGNENVIQEINKVKLPFEPSRLGQIAAAAALTDYDFHKKTTEMNRWSLSQLISVCEYVGIELLPDPQANFLTLQFETPALAKAAYQNMFELGLITRPLGPSGLPKCIRINSGNEKETLFAKDILQKLFTKKGKK